MFDFSVISSASVFIYWLIYGLITGMILALAGYMLWSSRFKNWKAYPTSPKLRKATALFIGVSAVDFLLCTFLVALLGGYHVEGILWYSTPWGSSCLQQMFILLFAPCLCYFLQSLLQGEARIRLGVIGLAMLFPFFLLLWTFGFGLLGGASESAIAAFSMNVLYASRVYWLIFIVILLYIYTKSLRNYEHRLQDVYSDTTHRHIDWLYILVILNGVYFAWYLLSYVTSIPLWLGIMVQHILTLLLSIYSCYHVDQQQLITWGNAADESRQIDIDPSVITELDKKVNEWVKTKGYLNPDLTRDELVLALQTNRTYLNIYFTQKNLTFYKFVNAHRVNYAISLMKDSAAQRKLLQVAEESGFKSLEVFSRQFKAIKGLSPSQYIVK